MKILYLLTFAFAKHLLENYSFDFSSKKMPLAYQSYGNAVELEHKVKLNSIVNHMGGAYDLNRPITAQEF